MALVECNPSARPTSGGFNSIGPSLMIWSGRGGRPSVTSNSTEALRSMQVFIIVLPRWFCETTFLWQISRLHNVTPLRRIFNYIFHNSLYEYFEKSMSFGSFYFKKKWTSCEKYTEYYRQLSFYVCTLNLLIPYADVKKLNPQNIQVVLVSNSNSYGLIKTWLS